MQEIPRMTGAYVLVVRLSRPLVLDIATLPAATLKPGLYAYCGSAYGPGGLAARLARHLRKSKSVRWHVDRLTAAGETVAAAVRVGGRECDLVDRLLSLDACVAVRGFGSSDCRRCPAHLVDLPDGFDAALAGLDRVAVAPL